MNFDFENNKVIGKTKSYITFLTQKLGKKVFYGILIFLFILFLLVFCGRGDNAKSGWKVYQNVDEFGDEAGGNIYILENQKGTYSSAVSEVRNGNMNWEMRILPTETLKRFTVNFIIKENGKDVDLSSYDDEYTVIIKDDNGETHEYPAEIVNNSGVLNALEVKFGLLFNPCEMFTGVLVINKNPKIVISDKSGIVTYSLGTVQTAGLEDSLYKTSLSKVEKLIDKGNFEDANQMLSDYHKERPYGWQFDEKEKYDELTHIVHENLYGK